MSYPSQPQRPKKKSHLRRTLFLLSSTTAIAALVACFWPIDKETLVRVYDRDQKVGCVNLDGRMIIEPRWDLMRPFDQLGLAVVTTEGKQGLIDKSGKVVAEPIWDTIADFNENGLAQVEKDDHHGLINQRGEVVIAPEWEDIGDDFGKHGLTWVVRDNKAGWVSRRGAVLVKPFWDRVRQFDSEGMAPVKINGKWGWIGTKGEILIQPEWDEFAMLTLTDKIKESTQTFSLRRLFKRGWGAEQVESYDLSEEYFDSNGLVPVKKNDLWGCIDRQGNIVFPIDSEIPYRFDEQGMSLFLHHSRWGWMDVDGEVVIDPTWDKAKDFDPVVDYAPVLKEKWGWINRKGELVIQPKWDEVKDFDNQGMAEVKLDGKWGWVDTKGEIVIQPSWDSVGEFDQHGIAKVGVNVPNESTRLGLVNRRGDILVDPEWHTISEFDEEGMAAVMKQSKVGWINRQGAMVIPWKVKAWFSTLGNSFPPRFNRFGLAKVESKGKWGWINRRGEYVIPPKSHKELFSDFDDYGLALVREPIEAPAVVPDKGNRRREFTEGDIRHLFQGEFIDLEGNHVMGLPAPGWYWDGRLMQRYSDQKDQPAAYVAVNLNLRTHWLRRLYLRLMDTLNEKEEGTVNYDYEVGCIAYDQHGNVIWDSRKMSFEQKCWLILAAALVLGLLTRPRAVKV